ncbi:MAG: glycosyltransferase [Candidatus Limnocylindrales bacterium]
MLQAVAVPPLFIDAYGEFIGEAAVAGLRQFAEPLAGARVLHLNATSFGGGVAELLPTMTALMCDLGLDAEWRVIPGDDAFFDVTKALHNGLQGMSVGLDARRRATYAAAQQRFAAAFDGAYDFVIVHDPQPAGLRRLLPTAAGSWIWRCHIDLTAADAETWAFLRPEIEAYDAAIFTLPEYVQADLRLSRLAYIPPSIDPLSPKNRIGDPAEARAVVARFGIDPQRPLLLQVSRFDPWKDPLGVIDAYRRVKAEMPGVQLALVGSMATDDPEGWRVYQQVLRHAGEDDDLVVLSNLDGVNSREVNAFQQASTIVLQKSLREGFGLTVTEALWKGKPVIAGRVGGIPMQLGDTGGRLVDSVDDTVQACRDLLGDADLRRRLGEGGRERVRQHFLSTREVRDHLALLRALKEHDDGLLPRGIAA